MTVSDLPAEAVALCDEPGVAPALEVKDLDVAYRIRGRDLQVLRNVSFSVGRGESYGLVGESGCGKSTVALAALGGLPRNGIVRGGEIRIEGRDLAGLRAPALRAMRAKSVSMVYQDAGRALNPSITIGRQMAEVFELLGIHGKEALDRCEAMLQRVQIASPGRVIASYPHQLSGGMLQRVVIAMALSKDPTLLVLDEPTTALDATVEAEVLDLIAGLRKEFSASVLFISHNLGVIEQMCDRIGVLYAGSLVEEGSARDLLRRPMHPYTVRLLRCLPAAGRSKTTARLETIEGFLPPPGVIVPGCVFAARCDLADELCHTVPPPPHADGGHSSLCHHWERVGELSPGVPEPAVPEIAGTNAVEADRIVLRARNLSKSFRIGGRALHAVE
ncbi:MAG TPA: ABC transporter ATP-binding protein, partial [Acidiphilium sp.]